MTTTTEPRVRIIDLTSRKTVVDSAEAWVAEARMRQLQLENPGRKYTTATAVDYRSLLNESSHSETESRAS